jgi:hypothetical protein
VGTVFSSPAADTGTVVPGSRENTITNASRNDAALFIIVSSCRLSVAKMEHAPKARLNQFYYTNSYCARSIEIWRFSPKFTTFPLPLFPFLPSTGSPTCHPSPPSQNRLAFPCTNLYNRLDGKWDAASPANAATPKKEEGMQYEKSERPL